MSSVTVFSKYGIEARWNSSLNRYTLHRNGFSLPRVSYATEAKAIEAAKRKARRLEKADLAAWYVQTIGYDPFQDDPGITVEQVRQIKSNYLAEENNP